jgi:uracil-DNA glycosylase family protein
VDDLERLRAQAADCRNCDLWEHATQTVFGEGRPGAPLMFVGEQPGDHEDLEGSPFVGPAGALLDKAMAEVGIARDDVYVTNAVKHFKFEQRGKRRIHKRPGATELKACHPWLDAELEVVHPRMVCALGAIAAQSLYGSKFKVTVMRGQLVSWDREPAAMATVHPSSILRAPDDAARRSAYAEFVNDLQVAASVLDAA